MPFILKNIHGDGLYFEFLHDKMVLESPLLGGQKNMNSKKTWIL